MSGLPLGKLHHTVYEEELRREAPKASANGRCFASGGGLRVENYVTRRNNRTGEDKIDPDAPDCWAFDSDHGWASVVGGRYRTGTARE